MGMVLNIDDNFSDNSGGSSSDERVNDGTENGNTLSAKKIQEQAQKNLMARKRIDELQEKKRLKDLLDDSEDW